MAIKRYNHLAGNYNVLSIGLPSEIETPPAGAVQPFINTDGSLWVKYPDGSSASMGGSFTLPVATSTILGGIKEGPNTTIAPDGTLSVPPQYVLPTATASIKGGVKQGPNTSIAPDGTISVAAPYVLPAATAFAIGGVKPGTGLSVLPDGTLNAAGGVSNVTANALFVDVVYGNDGTATPGSLVNKYQTLAAALAASTSGSLIYVNAGTYNLTPNLWKNGVTYYFEAGTQINAASTTGIFSPTGAGQTCRVYGYGNFTNTSTGGVFKSVGGYQSTFYMEAQKLIGLQNTVQLRDGWVTIKARSIETSSANGAIDIVDSLSLLGNNSAIIEVTEYVASNSTYSGVHNPCINNTTSSTGYQGTFKLTADQILTTPLQCGAALKFDNYIVPNGAVMEFNVREIVSRNDSLSVPMVYYEYHNNTKTIYNINKLSGGSLLPSGTRAGFASSSAFNSGNEVVINGDIETTGYCIYTGGSGDVFRFNGKARCTNDLIAIGADAVNGRLYLNGVVQLDTAVGTPYGIRKYNSSQKIIIDDLTVITDGSVGASYQSASPDTVIVRHSAAHNTAPINITNAITGSAFYTDTLLIA